MLCTQEDRWRGEQEWKEEEKSYDGSSASTAVDWSSLCGFRPCELAGHPRILREKARRHQEELLRSLDCNRRRKQLASIPQGLVDAIEAVKLHLPKTPEADAAATELDRQLTNLSRSPEPKYTLLTDDETPVTAQHPYPGVLLSRATYEANDPSEDRSTVVVGDNFIFAGVWDGHGGTAASEYTQSHIFPAFKNAIDGGASISEAFRMAYKKVDNEYLTYARALDVPRARFAGTCAIACYVDCATGQVTCGNLGDSRAVMGVYESGELRTVALSVDHSAHNRTEQERIRQLHPYDPEVVVDVAGYDSDDEEPDDPDWRVKKICAFTRSLGDLHLKDKGSAALYNSYVPAERRLLPRPGVPILEYDMVTPPYITNVPEIKDATIEEGFIIIACDGVWDEMSSEEAVRVCGELLASGAGSNVAELFIDETLKKAVMRISKTIEEEQNLTLDELKSRPQGKADWTCRSWLHDDITVVILDFHSSNGSRVHQAKYNNGTVAATTRELYDMIGNNNRYIEEADFERLLAKLGKSSQELKQGFLEIDRDSKGHVDFDEFEAWWETQRLHSSTKKRLGALSDAIAILSDEIERQKGDTLRKETNTQMMKLVDLFDGMTKPQLKILFDALDVDGNGTLDREEVGRLLSNVLTTTVTPVVLDTIFSEMDDDGSGTVDLTEFCQFFGII